MKKSISLLLVMCIVLAGCGKSSTDTTSTEIVLNKNQSIKYGQVTKIHGNELTVALATEVSTSDMQSQRGNKDSAGATPNATDKANKNQSGNASGSSSENGQAGDPGAGGPPDMAGGNPPGDGAGGNPPGDMPQGGGQGGFMPGEAGTSGKQQSESQGASGQTSGKSSSGNTSGSNASSGRQNKDSQNQSSSNKGGAKNRVRYQLTGEEETLTIPVGTKVTTSLGTTTTFSRIAANDTLKLLMEKNEAGEEVVVGVWIVA